MIKENEEIIQKFNNYVNRPRIEEEEVKGLIQASKVQEYKLKNQLKLIDGKLKLKNFKSNICFDQTLELNFCFNIESKFVNIFEFKNFFAKKYYNFNLF